MRRTGNDGTASRHRSSTADVTHGALCSLQCSSGTISHQRRACGRAGGTSGAQSSTDECVKSNAAAVAAAAKMQHAADKNHVQ